MPCVLPAGDTVNIIDTLPNEDPNNLMCCKENTSAIGIDFIYNDYF
jgi:hypothetical protein